MKVDTIIEINYSDADRAIDLLHDSDIPCDYENGCIYLYARDRELAIDLLQSSGIDILFW